MVRFMHEWSNIVKSIRQNTYTVRYKGVHGLPGSGLAAGLKVEHGGGVSIAPDAAEPPSPRAAIPHHHQHVTLHQQCDPCTFPLSLPLFLVILLLVIGHMKFVMSLFSQLEDELALLCKTNTTELNVRIMEWGTDRGRRHSDDYKKKTGQGTQCT